MVGCFAGTHLRRGGLFAPGEQVKNYKSTGDIMDEMMERIKRGERPIPDYPEGKSYDSFRVIFDSKSMLLICYKDPENQDDYDIIRLTDQQADCLSYELEDRRQEYVFGKTLEEKSAD